MKKSLIATFLLAGLPFFSQAAGFAPPAECYPLVHGENGQGSTNFIRLPHLGTHDGWSIFLSVTNESDKKVNVKFKFSDMNGAVYNPYGYSFQGSFNTNNSPFEIGGAILNPDHTAHITITDDAYQGVLSGKVIWQADSCINSALHVSVRSHHNGLSTLLQLNGGQLF